jgi:hypothetical protein
MTFTAYEGGRVTNMKRLKKGPVLITIGVCPAQTYGRKGLMRVGYAKYGCRAEDLAFG